MKNFKRQPDKSSMLQQVRLMILSKYALSSVRGLS